MKCRHEKDRKPERERSGQGTGDTAGEGKGGERDCEGGPPRVGSPSRPRTATTSPLPALAGSPRPGSHTPLSWPGQRGHRPASANRRAAAPSRRARPGRTREPAKAGVPGALDASTRLPARGVRGAAGGDGQARSPIDRGGPLGAGRHRSCRPAALTDNRGVSWRRASHPAGEAGISGSNWAGRRRGTSAPRGCRARARRN